MRCLCAVGALLLVVGGCSMDAPLSTWRNARMTLEASRQGSPAGPLHILVRLHLDQEDCVPLWDQVTVEANGQPLQRNPSGSACDASFGGAFQDGPEGGDLRLQFQDASGLANVGFRGLLGQREFVPTAAMGPDGTWTVDRTVPFPLVWSHAQDALYLGVLEFAVMAVQGPGDAAAPFVPGGAVITGANGEYEVVLDSEGTPGHWRAAYLMVGPRVGVRLPVIGAHTGSLALRYAVSLAVPSNGCEGLLSCDAALLLGQDFPVTLLDGTTE